MTAQETIAALAAELTRIGKMPEWSPDGHPDWLMEDVEGRDLRCRFRAEAPSLAALLGVAAEVMAENQIAAAKCFDDKWRLYTTAEGWSFSPKNFATYPEAVIAALKQIETEKGK